LYLAILEKIIEDDCKKGQNIDEVVKK